tara:strand:- start:360 stop:578 length:219 start_codon:yes stop_codon:yes gene_type:complete
LVVSAIQEQVVIDGPILKLGRGGGLKLPKWSLEATSVFDPNRRLFHLKRDVQTVEEEELVLQHDRDTFPQMH